MCDKNTKDPIQNDYVNVLIALSVKNHSYHRLNIANSVTNGNGKVSTTRVIMQLIKPQSKQHYYNSLNSALVDQLIIVDDIKLTLMAKSCFSKGIIPFITNLISTAGEPEKFDKEWKAEYAQGRTYELYRQKISDKLEGMRFREIAVLIYNKFRAILIALEMKNDNGNSVLLLNPSQMRVTDIRQKDIRIYIICSNSDIAEQISVMDREKPLDACSE